MTDRRLIVGASLSRRPQLSARPRLHSDGQVPRCTPEAELNRPRLPAQRVPSLKRRGEIDAAAELDRICAARPLKPPALPKENPTRSVGAAELAREIRRGSYQP